jgi:hypothetical protein
MADLNCADTLEPFLIRLKVIAQIQRGDVVVLDDAGQWLLQPNSTFRSGLRKLWAFVVQKPIQPQRSAFLKSAKETVRLLIKHCSLVMRTSPFLKALDPASGIVSQAAVAALAAAEVTEFEFVLQTLQSVSIHLFDGLRGLILMKHHEPYAGDLTWCSELTVMVVDAIVQFLDQVYRRLGPQHAARVLPFVFNTPAGSVAANASPILALTAQMMADASASALAASAPQPSPTPAAAKGSAAAATQSAAPQTPSAPAKPGGNSAARAAPGAQPSSLADPAVANSVGRPAPGSQPAAAAPSAAESASGGSARPVASSSQTPSLADAGNGGILRTASGADLATTTVSPSGSGSSAPKPAPRATKH